MGNSNTNNTKSMSNNDKTNINNKENIDENIIKKIKEQRILIKKGEYSEIFKEKNEKNEDVVLKIINRSNISQVLNNINIINLDNYIREKIDLMKKINQSTEYSIKINNFNNNNDIFIEMEYFGDDLKKYFNKINNKEKEIKINIIKEIFTKINETLIIIEKNKEIHGDIKPEHILINDKEEKNINPILIDYFNFNNFSKKYNLYTAPEILFNENEITKKNIKSDLWSIGIILYELYFNNFPFQSKDELLEIINSNKKLNLLKSDISKDFNDIIEKLLIINIDDRISFKDYINHNFWNNILNNNNSFLNEDKMNNSNIEHNINKINENFEKLIDETKNNTFLTKKEYIFEFNSDNIKKELDDFYENDLKEVEIFKFSGFARKYNFDNLKINVIQWIKKLKFSNLKKLYIDGNNIKNIEGLNELKLENLTHLYLHNNKINNLIEFTKIQFINLSLLDLSKNDIKNLESFYKVKLDKLKILNLSENKINDISNLKHLKFDNLKILNLSFNEIDNIEVLSKVSFINLKSLYLNNNKIQNIDIFSFIHFESLEILSLNCNNIINIESLKTSKLKNLKKLDLSFNKINNIDILISVPFVALESLNISFNQIDSINIFEELKLKTNKKICFYGNDTINFESLYVKNIINGLKNKHIKIIELKLYIYILLFYIYLFHNKFCYFIYDIKIFFISIYKNKK